MSDQNKLITFLKQKGNSKFQENIAEYSFLKDLLIEGVSKGVKILISRSDFDEFGYDILAQVEGNSKISKLQLKAVNGKARVWDIHKELLLDNDGNVVLILITEKDKQLHFEYLTLTTSDRTLIIKRSPKKANQKKCKINKGDLELVNSGEMLEKILGYTHNIH